MFFFKQKTAYEMRISDWSSDVCSSDLSVGRGTKPLGLLALGDSVRSEAAQTVATLEEAGLRLALVTGDNERTARRIAAEVGINEVHAGVQIGRASCRARVCPYV